MACVDGTRDEVRGITARRDAMRMGVSNRLGEDEKSRIAGEREKATQWNAGFRDLVKEGLRAKIERGWWRDETWSGG